MSELRDYWLVSSTKHLMDQVFFQANEAFNGCRTCIDRFATYNGEWRGGTHPLYDPNFIEPVLKGDERRYQAARGRLRTSLSFIDGKISSLWEAVSEEFRSNQVSLALKIEGPFREGPTAALSAPPTGPNELIKGLLAKYWSSEVPFGRAARQAFPSPQGSSRLNPEPWDLDLARANGTHGPPKSPELPNRLSDNLLDRQFSRVVRGLGPRPFFENEQDLFEAFDLRRSQLIAWKEAMAAFLPASQKWLSWAEHELREPAVRIDTVMFGGEKNVVQVTFGDGTTISAPFAIGNTIQNSLNANKIGHAPDNVKNSYEKLLQAIADKSSELSKAQCEDLAMDAETLGRELAREQPRQSRVRDTIDGIASSAATIGKAAGPILDAVIKLRAAIGI